MNPPFSAALHVQGRVAQADFHHVRSALARLPKGGRLVAVTGHNFPYELLNGAVRFTCAIDGAAYAKHGTTFETRLTVIDKSPETVSPASLPPAQTAAALLARVLENVPPPMEVAGGTGLSPAANSAVLRKIAPAEPTPPPANPAAPAA